VVSGQWSLLPFALCLFSSVCIASNQLSAAGRGDPCSSGPRLLFAHLREKAVAATDSLFEFLVGFSS
jgi:hypothetical protein